MINYVLEAWYMQTNVKAIMYLALFHLLPWRATAVTNHIHYQQKEAIGWNTIIASLIFSEDEQIDMKDFTNTETNSKKKKQHLKVSKLSEHKGSIFQRNALPNDIAQS